MTAPSGSRRTVTLVGHHGTNIVDDHELRVQVTYRSYVFTVVSTGQRFSPVPVIFNRLVEGT